MEDKELVKVANQWAKSLIETDIDFLNWIVDSPITYLAIKESRNATVVCYLHREELAKQYYSLDL